MFTHHRLQRNPCEAWSVAIQLHVIETIMQGIMAFAVVMGFMFALSDVPDVQVAVAQPIVPAMSLAMSAALGMEKLSWVSGLGIFFSVSGVKKFYFCARMLVCLG